MEQLGLFHDQINGIEVDPSLDEFGKAQKALYKWHDLLGFTATYRCLIEMFLAGDKALLAGEVCELLKGM